MDKRVLDLGQYFPLQYGISTIVQVWTTEKNLLFSRKQQK